MSSVDQTFSLRELLQAAESLCLRQFLPIALHAPKGVSYHLWLIRRPVKGASVTTEQLIQLSNFGGVEAIYLAGSYLIGYLIKSITQVTHCRKQYLFIGTVETVKRNIAVDVVYKDSDLMVLKNTISDSFILLPMVADVPKPVLVTA